MRKTNALHLLFSLAGDKNSKCVCFCEPELFSAAHFTVSKVLVAPVVIVLVVVVGALALVIGKDCVTLPESHKACQEHVWIIFDPKFKRVKEYIIIFAFYSNFQNNVNIIFMTIKHLSQFYNENVNVVVT